MKRFADPTNDIAFKKIFSEDNMEAIHNFIEAIIENVVDFPFSKKLKSLNFLNNNQMPNLIGGKKSLCDLKVEDDCGNIYIIEMQRKNEHDYLKRIQYYAAHAVAAQLDAGIGHIDIYPVITISIMGANCFDVKVPCISYHAFRETTTNKQLLEGQSHIFIELPKLNNFYILKGDVFEWLTLFKDASETNDIPDLHNLNVENAYHRLEKYNWSLAELEAYNQAQIMMDIEKNNVNIAREEGKIEGKIEAKIEIAKEMLLNNEPLNQIIKYSKLSMEEIDKLKITNIDEIYQS